jgi:hypothetical protein
MYGWTNILFSEKFFLAIYSPVNYTNTKKLTNMVDTECVKYGTIGYMQNAFFDKDKVDMDINDQFNMMITSIIKISAT